MTVSAKSFLCLSSGLLFVGTSTLPVVAASSSSVEASRVAAKPEVTRLSQSLSTNRPTPLPPTQSPAIPLNSSTPLTPPMVEEEYTLGPGDRIKVEVLRAPQYTLDTQIPIDGSLGLIQVGRISVRGMTLSQASQAASRQYAKLLRYPVVTITLVSARPIKVAVAGEVSRRGSYDLNSPTPENTAGSASFPTVTRALKLAGGITQAADLNRVQIRRSRYGSSDQVFTVNLWAFLRQGDTGQDIFLRDGDSVFVPTAERLDLNDSYQLATTSFSAEKIQPLNITVVGEVYRPGAYTVESSVRTPLAGNPGEARDAFNQARIFPTLTRALQTAGGIKPLADVRKVQVRRITQAGTEHRFDIDLWALLTEGDQKQDLILQDRDTIIIPTATAVTNLEASKIASASFSPDRIRVSVVGEVSSPGIIEVPPGTPLNKAIVAAGGFNARAIRSKVNFARLNQDGTIDKREVPVDFAATIDEKNNPALQNEDVIIVRRSGLSTFTEATQVFGPLGGIVSVFRAIFGGP
jgi:polysaccharide biosynthesis/export protein